MDTGVPRHPRPSAMLSLLGVCLGTSSRNHSLVPISQQPFDSYLLCIYTRQRLGIKPRTGDSSWLLPAALLAALWPGQLISMSETFLKEQNSNLTGVGQMHGLLGSLGRLG